MKKNLSLVFPQNLLSYICILTVVSTKTVSKYWEGPPLTVRCMKKMKKDLKMNVFCQTHKQNLTEHS